MRKPLIYKCNGCGGNYFDFDLIIKTTKVYECPNCKIEIKK
jgi:DNA-directed RNA polymerase subunit RPC12/RpoP